MHAVSKKEGKIITCTAIPEYTQRLYAEHTMPYDRIFLFLDPPIEG